MEMAQFAAFANLSLGGASRNPYILDQTRPGIAANMYPETAGPEFVPSTPVVQIGRMNTIPLMKPSTKTAQAGNREIYDRYIATTNQDTSPDSLIPVVYQLRLEKIARSYRNLEAKVTEMGEYARGLHRPNQNTNGAYRDF